MLKKIKLFFLFIMIINLIISAKTSSDAVLNKIFDNYRASDTFYSPFVFKSFWKLKDQKLVEKGEIFLKKENKYLIRYENLKDFYLCDGQNSYVYFSEMNQAYKSNITKSTTMQLNNYLFNLNEFFTVTKFTEEDDLYSFDLIPKDNSLTISKASISFDKKKYYPKKLELFSINGDIMQYDFLSPEFNIF